MTPQSIYKCVLVVGLLRPCNAISIVGGVFAQTLEAELHFAADAKEGILQQEGLTTTGVTVDVRDVQVDGAGKLEIVDDKSLLPSRGFVVLRPAFPESRFTQQQFEATLKQEDAAQSLSMFLQHPSGIPRLGFDWVTCSV